MPVSSRCTTLLRLQPAHRLPDLDLVPGTSDKRKVLGSLEYHDDRASQHESSHLLARRQGLAM